MKKTLFIYSSFFIISTIIIIVKYIGVTEYINKSSNKYFHYIFLSNHDKYNKRIRYIPRKSCGLGNKLLGLISSIACGIAQSSSLIVANWNSLWYYFSFPLKLDLKKYIYNKTYIGHFYGIKKVIENENTRNYLLKEGIIIYNKNINRMIYYFAYGISFHFLKVNNAIASSINKKYNNLDFGIHIRTGKADGKEYLLHYLKYEDVSYILTLIKMIRNKSSIYISSDSPQIKREYENYIKNIYYINSTSCNSGYGLLKENNKCANEAIMDYYILSKCNYLFLTRCSSFSLVSLFANKISFNNNRNYQYIGNCTIHSDLFE